MTIDRRSFLIAMGGTAAALSVPGRAGASTETDAWHVLYPGGSTRQDAREQLERIAGALGPDVARDLQVARRGDAFVVIYDRAGVRNPEHQGIAKEVAARHAALLRQVIDDDGELATIVSSAELQDTWNVRYGQPGSKGSLESAWATVARMLGAGVAKQLVIEVVQDDTHQLVYKRMGDRHGTEKVARHHHDLLRGTGLSATAVREGFGAITYDGTSAEASEALASPTPEADTGDDELVLRSSSTGTELRAAVNAHIQKLRQRGKVSRVERTSWVIHDLAADQTLCAINADRPMQAASMVKPFVALAFFHRVKQGKLVYGPRSTAHMERMIRDSSNSSTNWMMRQVGGPATCHAILHKHYGHLVDELRIVEYIPAGGRTYRNVASALDHARLLRALWQSDVPYAKELRRVMNLPGPDRLYRDVPQIPVGTQVYNKTGSTAMCCGDMGILVARRRNGKQVPYIVVGVIDRPTRATSYGPWVRERGDVIRQISGLAYRHLKQAYDLV